MRSFIVLLCLVPTLLLAQQSKLETQLKQAIKDKKAEIGIAVIINGKDTVTVNNDIHYPLMSVFKFHQALALADYMGKKKQSLDTRLPIIKSDLKPDTYSPLRDKYPQGGIEMSIADLLRYTLQQSDNNACDILLQTKVSCGISPIIRQQLTEWSSFDNTDSSLCASLFLFRRWRTPELLMNGYTYSLLPDHLDS